MRLLSIVLVSFSLVMVGCGGSGGGDGTDEAGVEPGTSAEAPNIVTSRQFFGQNGNLWKPKAEEKSSTAGLLVVLLGPQFTGQFNACEVRRTDGSVAQLDCNDRVEWSHTPFSCVANGGREHWRASFTCDQAAAVRVVCRNFNQEVTFEAPGAGVGAVCARHG